MHKVIAWTAVFLWMVCIFLLSHEPAAESNQLSKDLTEVIVKTAETVAPDAQWNIDRWNGVVRKNAHFFAYFILGFLVIHALRRSGLSGFRGALPALAVCVLYAVSDEVHQLYVPGRSGQVRDVLIDSAGAGVAIGLAMAFRFGRRRRHR